MTISAARDGYEQRWFRMCDMPEQDGWQPRVVSEGADAGGPITAGDRELILLERQLPKPIPEPDRISFLRRDLSGVDEKVRDVRRTACRIEGAQIYTTIVVSIAALLSAVDFILLLCRK